MRGRPERAKGDFRKRFQPDPPDFWEVVALVGVLEEEEDEELLEEEAEDAAGFSCLATWALVKCRARRFGAGRATPATRCHMIYLGSRKSSSWFSQTECRSGTSMVLSAVVSTIGWWRRRSKKLA
jgi:hypothetical protein